LAKTEGLFFRFHQTNIQIHFGLQNIFSEKFGLNKKK